MTNSTPEKGARERSPSFPFIPLKAAIERLVEFESKFGRQEPPADRAYLAWGMKGYTSQAQQTLAALKSFGLVEYKGGGPKRGVAISDAGRTYLRAQQENVKQAVLKKAASTPKWIAHFWTQWGSEPVPDEIRLDALVLTHKFNENSAPTFLRVYDETIAYAGLSDSDKPTGEIEPPEDDEMEPGFEPGLKPSPPKPGVERAEFPLPEGVVRLEFPASLSTASYEDFEAWVALVLRRAKRGVSNEDEAAD